MKKVRIKDVALQAGVSTGTVDRVIHNRGRVHPDVKKKVEKVMKELGYVRNVFASALAKNQMVRLGVLIPDPELDPYWKQLFTGIEKATKFVQHHGIQVEHYFFDLHDAKSFLRQAKKMMKTSYEGVLFPPIYKKEGMWLLKTCKQKNIPNIIINTFIEHTESLCYIGQDSYQSGVLAARLIKSSTADPATFLILNLTKGAHQKQHLFEKARGFKDYFKNDKSVNVLLGEFEDFSNQRKLKNYFKRIQKKHPDLTGIFLTNSRAYFAVEALGADFLEKIKIVGFDLVDKNVTYLQANKIDFLINQNPSHQGYFGILNLYKHLLLKAPIPKVQYLSLDIVVKENFQCYVDQPHQEPVM